MNTSRNRKIAYLLSIVVLFTALITVSSVIESSAQTHKLSQKSLGKVNPVSGTAQLVMMGFRGVAVTFLWYEANELKRKERWFEIRPVVESITLLQPNFVNPWTFQAWNMAYNIAAEWEAVPDKYYWMRQGIDFLKRASETNADIPDLEHEVGWLYHNRFGMSDEKTYLREEYKIDPDTSFTMPRQSGIKDSFEVAYEWFSRANATIERTQRPPRTKGITPFMSYPAVAKSSFAEFLEKDGFSSPSGKPDFDEFTKNAWRTAHEKWKEIARKGEPGRYVLIHKMEYTEEEKAKLTEEEKYWADRYAKMINYYYWKKRTQLESEDETLFARKAFYDANEAHRNGDYEKAIEEYEKAFPVWRKIIEGDELLRGDDGWRDESQEQEARYLRLLSRLDKPAPMPRPFEGLYEALVDQTAPVPTDLAR